MAKLNNIEFYMAAYERTTTPQVSQVEIPQYGTVGVPQMGNTRTYRIEGWFYDTSNYETYMAQIRSIADNQQVVWFEAPEATFPVRILTLDEWRAPGQPYTWHFIATLMEVPYWGNTIRNTGTAMLADISGDIAGNQINPRFGYFLYDYQPTSRSVIYEFYAKTNTSGPQKIEICIPNLVIASAPFMLHTYTGTTLTSTAHWTSGTLTGSTTFYFTDGTSPTAWAPFKVGQRGSSYSNVTNAASAQIYYSMSYGPSWRTGFYYNAPTTERYLRARITIRYSGDYTTNVP